MLAKIPAWAPFLHWGWGAATATAPPPLQTCRAGSPGSERAGSRSQAPPAPSHSPTRKVEGREGPRTLKTASRLGDHPAQSLLCFHDATRAKAAARISAREAGNSHRPGAPWAASPGEHPVHTTPDTKYLICISNVSQTISFSPLQLLPMKSN